LLAYQAAGWSVKACFRNARQDQGALGRPPPAEDEPPRVRPHGELGDPAPRAQALGQAGPRPASIDHGRLTFPTFQQR